MPKDFIEKIEIQRLQELIESSTLRIEVDQRQRKKYRKDLKKLQNGKG